jgi:hypothetical protein
MLPAGYQVSKPDAIAAWLVRLLESARRRRLQLAVECDPAEATRREVAAAAVALVAAVGVLAEEARS